MKKLILFGGGKQAKCMYKILSSEGVSIDGFCVDKEYFTEDSFLDLPMYDTESFFRNCSPDEFSVFLPLSAKDRCRFRKKKFLQFQEQGYQFFTFISKTSKNYTELSNIGTNVYFGHAAATHPDVIIEDNCYISEMAAIGHDCRIGKHSFIGPKALLCGSCDIGERVIIGAGAVLRENISIADGTIIGMGISVHKSIDKEGVYVFSPLEEEHFVVKRK